MAKIIVRIDLGPFGRIGPGKIQLLELVASLGSISGAARDMNMSYRQAWALIDQMNASFKEPVVAARTGGKQGGGAKLTAFGHDVLSMLKAVQEDAARATAARVRDIEGLLRPTL